MADGLPDQQEYRHTMDNLVGAKHETADGSDDPAGRQKNRRVEIVIDTCG